MQKINFNDNWFYNILGEKPDIAISLPHDAMFSENRTAESEGLGHVSWHIGNDYIYEKTFFVPKEYQDKKIVFEFEGVYRNAEVFINNQKVMYRPYGYTNFYIDASEYLSYDSENTIQVIARNADQPNSRWYSGSGIYRPVTMYVLNKEHIKLNGIKIDTVSINPAKIRVSIETTHPGELKVDIYDSSSILVASTTETTEYESTLEIDIPDAKLWGPNNPNLYTCRVKFAGEIYEETFGIRTIFWDSNQGFKINGIRTILKGACVHHDNGLLGAASYEDAERRKVKLIKNVGYNAIRSAHNPCSKAMLKACDELGMLVMDEYVDMWYIHKTRYDYADYFMDWWQQDIKDMVDKDYNHPSVIMYSTGNEVSETGEKKGIEITKELTDYIHQLDSTRPVTCGVNIFFNYLSSLGFGVYSDKKANEEGKKNKPVGSEFYNKLAGILGDKTMKIGATLRGSDIKTRDAFLNMDIAGYNYGILRYKGDLKKYPNRLILGTETFCKDAYTFMELAKDNPRIIGDFVWSGIDYLGEVAVGSWVYEDYMPKNSPEEGWMTAGSGRIDITGRELGEALYTKVALEKTKGPLIAVKPVYQVGKHSPSAWKMTDAMPSWSWSDCEGMKAEIEVYARAAKVKLFLNNRLIGEQKKKKDCRFMFKTKYYSGELKAIAYDENELEIGNSSLHTASNETKLTLTPEEKTVRPNGLAYIRISFTDIEGILKPMEKHLVNVEVTGGKLLGLGHACPYNPEGYKQSQTKTYYGEALAIVQADEDVSLLSVYAKAGTMEARELILVEKEEL